MCHHLMLNPSWDAFAYEETQEIGKEKLYWSC
jgi:hypothetical protein